MELWYQLIVALVIAGVVFWLVIWFVDYIGIPEPFNKVIKVVVALAALIFVLNKLLPLANVNIV